jgi:aspartate kinase
MPLIVQKFGGTSVADTEKILAAARKAVRAAQEGAQVVLVVSAMGKNTDELVRLAGEICDDPPAREMDMLLSTGEQVSVALMAMAIHTLGREAVSLTGAQIGIKTDSIHTKARIQSISTERMRRLLDDGKIVIAAGFQGIDEDFNITTLGRGGSDTTAVALAAVLEADVCEIYTDVDGVYTTDPRLLPEARQVRRVNYDEMLELASLGAGVMHSRSIEFGKKFSVPIHVRSSFSDVPGTIIGPFPESQERSVSGAALTRDEARITIEGVPDEPGVSLAIFSGIAERNIPIDMIVQNVGAEGRATISFTVLAGDLPHALEAVERAAQEIGAGNITHDDQVSKVSVVGLGMAQQTGVAEKMFRALAEAGVNILIITTSEIKISALVARSQARDALRTVHQAFALDQEPADAGAADENLTPTKGDAAAVVQRLQGMEDLTIDDITLDSSQARVTITNVPDRPGVAAQVFEEVAAAGVFVDMIVQSIGHDGQASLSFTVPQDNLPTALDAAGALAKKFGCPPVSSSPRVAKLSVSGIGMRSHTGVAIRMFKALSDAGINVAMTNTSEMQVNTVVDGSRGEEALACMQAAFEDIRE